MADPAFASCNNPDHSTLVTTLSQQSTLVVQLFAKIQELERKLEAAQLAAQSPPAPQNPIVQAPNFTTTPESGYVGQQDYSPPAPSAYETKKAQAQGTPCHFGANCTREQCWYEHPNSRTTATSRPSTSNQNQNPPTSNSTNSTRRTKQECRNGIECTRVDCRFEHPPNWVPPSNVIEEPQPQQEFGTEAPAAEVDNWGNNPDLSSWGATATNDWGTPADNTWGAPAVADNGWGPSTDNSWNASSNQRQSTTNHSRSASASMSREGSVANSSTNRSSSNQRQPTASNSRSASTSMSREGSVANSSTSRSRRGARGKGRRADSESIATESTPMSPASIAPTPISTYVEPIPAQASLSPPTEPVEQTSTLNEPDTSEETNTPVLESGPSSSSEPEAPGTPKASWSDEPTVDVVYFPDPPPDQNEQLASVPEDNDIDPPAADDLDQYAPSALYSSWGATGASASDWGLDPTEFPDPTPPVDNKSSGKKSKGKGKQKETSTNGRNTPMSRSSNPAAQSGTSTPSMNEPEPAPRPPTPEPPQGVPHDEIPDWLLGGDEDAHAMLGIPRAASPKPEGLAAPPRLAPTNPAPRAPLSKLAAENFPTLSGILPASKSSQPKDETPAKPTFSPRPVGWKITRSSDSSSSSGRSKGSKSKDSSSQK